MRRERGGHPPRFEAGITRAGASQDHPIAIDNDDFIALAHAATVDELFHSIRASCLRFRSDA